MAPSISKKRTSARSKASRVTKPVATTTVSRSTTGNPSASKVDRRAIKHSSFVTKIEKSSSNAQKRRRPNKKLVADLESLADALPGLEDDGNLGGADGEIVVGQAKIQKRKNLKSLRSRPGAMKRREALEKVERERFNANLAQMAGKNQKSTSIADRWAALKTHVQNTSEMKTEFANK